MDPDGLRQWAEVRAAYEDVAYWHEGAVLGFCGKKGMLVCTPHWHLYVERIVDYASLQSLGPRGGCIPPAVLRTGRVVRLNHAELQEKWDMRGTAAEKVERPTVKSDTTWVAMETSNGIFVGSPYDKAWKIEERGGRAVAVTGTLSLSVAKTNTWRAPVPCASMASALVDDMWTLSITYDSGGERGREWGTSVLEITEADFDDWPREGPRTCLWLLAAIRRQGVTPMSRGSWWKPSPGLCLADPEVADQALLGDLFESAFWHDGLDIGKLLCCVQWHIAEKLKVEAAIEKERRKAQEERFRHWPSRAQLEGARERRRRKRGGGEGEG